MNDHDRYEEWDAAYVLGALSPTERREFEEHLTTCDRCSAAVAELAVMPGLLAALPEADALAQLAPVALDGAPSAVPDLLPRLASRLRRHRRSRRWAFATVGALAGAATAAALFLVVPGALESSPHAAVTASLEQQVPTPVTADVSLTAAQWGTTVAMTCTYQASSGPSYSRRYALYVLNDSGAPEQVSSWTASPGETVDTNGSTATPVDQIDRVELRDLTTGTLLLSHTFR